MRPPSLFSAPWMIAFTMRRRPFLSGLGRILTQTCCLIRNRFRGGCAHELNVTVGTMRPVLLENRYYKTPASAEAPAKTKSSAHSLALKRRQTHPSRIA